MGQTFQAREIETGYHPDGYRIDKTASPMDRYTSWQITAEGRWTNKQPVCFDSMPQDGWIKADPWEWERLTQTE